MLKNNGISRAAIGRLPLYLNYLRSLSEYTKNISATVLAKNLNLGEVQVRKDLSAVSGAGKPKTGYEVRELIESLEDFLGYNKKSIAVIIGAGKLGKALLDYPGFEEFGLSVSAAFDNSIQDAQNITVERNIYPIKDLDDFCKKNEVKIGIIAVPKESAQEVCDKLIKNDIKAIWSFAPCLLNTPPDIPVRYENMALSLAYLSKQVQNDQ